MNHRVFVSKKNPNTIYFLQKQRTETFKLINGRFAYLVQNKDKEDETSEWRDQAVVGNANERQHRWHYVLHHSLWITHGGNAIPLWPSSRRAPSPGGADGV